MTDQTESEYAELLGELDVFVSYGVRIPGELLEKSAAAIRALEARVEQELANREANVDDLYVTIEQRDAAIDRATRAEIERDRLQLRVDGVRELEEELTHVTAHRDRLAVEVEKLRNMYDGMASRAERLADLNDRAGIAAARRAGGES